MTVAPLPDGKLTRENSLASHVIDGNDAAVHSRTQPQAAQFCDTAPTLSPGATNAPQSQPEEELSALERFCTDVTDEARQGMLDPWSGAMTSSAGCTFSAGAQE